MCIIIVLLFHLCYSTISIKTLQETNHTQQYLMWGIDRMSIKYPKLTKVSE